MSLDIRWLAPVAIFAAAAPQSYAALYLSLEQAQGLIFSQADEFVAKAVALTPDQTQRIEQLSGVKARIGKHQVWQAKAAGKPIGWFIIDQVLGKHEMITYAVGITPEGAVRQFQVLEYKEAYGYQVRELKWRDQFVGKTVTSPLAVGVDIVNISGGTMSSNHVTEGIKRLLALHQIVLR